MREISRFQVTGVVMMSWGSAENETKTMGITARSANWRTEISAFRRTFAVQSPISNLRPPMEDLLLGTVGLCQIVDENRYVFVLDARAFGNHRSHNLLPFVFAEMLSGDKIQVMASRARLLKELFGRTIICSATGLGRRGGLACAEVLYEVIDEDRHILRIDLCTV